MSNVAGARRLALQSARGACLAVHSATGLAAGASLEATRLLRAAEGLVRSAMAVLDAVGAPAPAAVKADGNAAEVPTSVHKQPKPGKRNGKGKDKEKDQSSAMAGEERQEGLQQAALPTAPTLPQSGASAGAAAGNAAAQAFGSAPCHSPGEEAGARWMEVDVVGEAPLVCLQPQGDLPGGSASSSVAGADLSGTAGLEEVRRHCAIAGPHAELLLEQLMSAVDAMGNHAKPKGKDGSKRR